jgi:hypothetical protein
MPEATNNNVRVQSAIAYALAQIGKPYVWASAGPNSFDCSGLIYASFKHAGYSFRGRPTTYTLIGMGSEVAKVDLQPGDLVFPDPGHVQIYLGGGMIIEAPHTGANVRRVRMWGFWRARRLISNNLSSDHPADGSTPSTSNTGTNHDAELESFAHLATAVTDPHWWVRILMIIIGVVMILLGAGRMATGDVTTIVSGVTNG